MEINNSSDEIVDTCEMESNNCVTPEATMSRYKQCTFHNGKKIDMYCQFHNAVGCRTCMDSIHRSCGDDVSTISEILDYIGGKGELVHSLIVDIPKFIHKTEEMKEGRFQEKYRLRNEKSKYLSKVRERRAQIEEYMDSLKRQEEIFNEKHDEMEGELNGEIRGFGRSIEHWNSLLDELKGMPDAITPDIFVDIKSHEQQLMVSEKELQDRKSACKDYLNPFPVIPRIDFPNQDSVENNCEKDENDD